MSPSGKNVANAVGGKTARACDSCITKRARWYCAADDAFLCQACDSSVHSANPLARRHQRLRLKAATLDPLNTTSTCAPTWHHGFTKKARTPRNGGKTNHSSSSTRPTSKSCWSSRINNQQPFHLVPEEGEGSDEVNSHEENEEQLLYRVPVFDPFVADLCSPAENNTKKESEESKSSFGSHLHGFLPSEAELAEFAADVESLLGRGMENECVGMEHLGLIDNNNKVVKVEMEQEQEHMDATCSSCKLEEGDNDMMMMEIGRETAFQLSFDYDESHETEEIDKEKVKERENDYEDAINKKRKILLQLDYEGVINAWGGSHKSPWTTGHKPNLDLHDCWPHTMATGGTEFHHGYGELMIGLGCNPSSVILGDGGREARVSRYREKRRTRLFSKKIRYEVRKLNAEKRPRMKGRFVKRASFAAPFPLIAK
ncbi:zinc finger protein CONSTANS-LIKE 16-like [Arachis stenosperma]|uniref:zinc finger protein CONSTANS-LIKE 16-like n=1 Tax=Arachis stenosperma TaxID=217475 RepID=UPI0025AD529B|nr:zinc finger protein CONSTANS-LIKE 16-like [Arachis stenosperma]